MTPRAEPEITTLRHARVAVLPATSVPCALTVVEGPDAGKRFGIDDAAMRRVLIGQSQVCDVQLSDRAVSRRHAALESDARCVRVVDLDSRNGTWVGGVRVRDAYLSGGDIVHVGSSSLRFEVGAAPQLLAAPDDTAFGRMLGASPEMRRLYPRFAQLAASTVPVLIEGETGTGKEVLAEALHDASDRVGGPFVVFDCSSVSTSLLDAELFGHTRGAFTGALEARTGMFEQADGGTLFIDEIGDLGLELQSKLLRAIERSEVRRIGSNDWIKVNVRIIAATRRDLDEEVQARRFRDDLFYRLAVGRIELPPLRKRQGDVAFLAQAMWRELGGRPDGVPPEVLQRLEAYPWPGNVRELHNAVARQLALGDADLRSPAGLEGLRQAEDFIDRVVADGKPLTRARQDVIAELERRYVARALAEHGGKVGSAAAALGIGRRYFQKLRAKR